MEISQDRLYTYADVLTWPENVRCELHYGKLVVLETPLLSYHTARGSIMLQLANHLRRKPVRVYTAPFDVRLFEKQGDAPENVDTVLQPDVLVVCNPEKIDQRGIYGAPDLIVEITFPTNAYTNRTVKHRMYEQAGVPEYWIVDMEQKLVQVHLLEDGRYHSPEIYHAIDRITVTRLEGCVIDLKDTFRNPFE